MRETETAMKIHRELCPKCNGRCHCSTICAFEETSNPEVWIANYVNAYFLELAESAERIMYECNISLDELLNYAKGEEEIPQNIQEAMEKYQFS